MVAACATSSGLARSKFGDPLPRHTPVHFGQRKCYLCAEIERVIPNKDRGNFPMTRLLIVMIVLGAAVVPASSQSAAATPDPQVSALQAQIELLQKQKEYEKLQSDLQEQRLKSLLDVTRNGAKPPENQTTYKPEERPSAEVSALSYDALNELSQQIVRQITAVTGRYSAIVVYNDNDFLTLAKYRLYRHQSDIALANYKKLKDDLAAAAGKAGVVDCDNAANSSDPRCQGGRRGMWSLPEMGTKAAGGVSALQSLFAAPAIATSLTGSVADLMAMFRSETIITPSRDTVDQSSLATAMGSALLANNRDMKILVPAAFLPEYDLDVEGRESILMRVSDVNQAYADISDFLSNTGDLAPLRKETPPGHYQAGRSPARDPAGAVHRRRTDRRADTRRSCSGSVCSAIHAEQFISSLLRPPFTYQGGEDRAVPASGRQGHR